MSTDALSHIYNHIPPYVKINTYCRIFLFMQEDWVLCRVFYKSKTESNTQLSPQNVYHHTEATAGGDNFSDPAQIMLPACNNNYLHQVITSQSQAPHHQNPNNIQTFTQLNPNFLHQLSHQLHTDRVDEMIMVSSKCDEDQYGFLFDMDFAERNVEDGMTLNVEDMKFEDAYSLLL